MEAKYMAAKDHYLTAFFCIENGTLFAAEGNQEYHRPVFPAVKSSKGYTFIASVKHQNFVDDILNSMFVNVLDHNQKFSIILRGKESCVSSNGTIIFAVSKTVAALHYAAKQIYENLEQFKKLHFDGYSEELAIEFKSTFLNS